MSYAVKAIFYTLQGEGARAGRPAVFLRFAGCNLWSGREKDRASSVCQFCDTDFVGTDGPGGGKFATAELLADAVKRRWPANASKDAVPYVVCTGGEPLLQIDAELIAALKVQGFEIAVETNGTIEAPAGIDWLTVSPKAGSEILQRSGNELKLVFPQPEPEAQPDKFAGADFEHFYLQPMDGVRKDRNTEAVLEYCLRNPQWRFSLQTHKVINIA